MYTIFILIAVVASIVIVAALIASVNRARRPTRGEEIRYRLKHPGSSRAAMPPGRPGRRGRRR